MTATTITAHNMQPAGLSDLVSFSRGTTVKDTAQAAALSAEELELQQLVSRAKGGDKRAFAALVGKTYDRAFNVAFHTLRSADDARDVVQEAFVRVQRGIVDFQGHAKFTTWLYRVVVNLCLDAIRRRKSGPIATDPMELDTEDRRRSPEQVTGDSELALVLERGLHSLSETHRLALVLYEIEGLSYDDIAKVMNTRIGTVMSRLFHARKKMQAFLRAELKDAAPDLGESEDSADGEGL